MSASQWMAAVSELLCARAGTGWAARNDTTVASKKIAARFVTRTVWHALRKKQSYFYFPGLGMW